MSRTLGSATMGLVAVLAALVRMQSLIMPSEQQPSWFVVLAAAFVVGAVAGFAGRSMRLGALSTAALVMAGTYLVLGRILAADTLYLGVLPTGPTWSAIGTGLASGLEYLRFATVPVRPAPDLVLLIATFLAWIAAAWGWLVATGRAVSAALVAAGFYLTVAMADQDPTRIGWTLGAVAWVAALLMTHGVEDTRRLPRFIGDPPRVAVAVLGVVVALVSMGLVRAVGDTGAGTLAWSNVSDLAGVRRGVSVNLFASMVQTDLVNQSEEVAFTAVVEGHPEPERLYWRLISLDRYDGRTWRPTFGQAMVGFEPAQSRFRGDVSTISQMIRIETLRQQLLPTAYAADAVTGDQEVVDEARPRVDGAVELLGGRTSPGLEYHVVSSVPRLDLAGAVAVAPGGPPRLVERGAIPSVVGDALADRERFVALPDRIDARIGALADDITAVTDNQLEQMLLLEAYFRSSDTFTYSLDIEPGHGADDLAEWLFDEDSPNHRVGYCEQFATAMAVMGRTLDIPTRVVIGFAPGEVADGQVTVRGRNAHAWVEAWIDHVGWVQLDPTPQSDTAPPTVAALGFDITQRARDTAATSTTTPTDTTLPATTGTTLPEFAPDESEAPVEATPGSGTRRSLPPALWWLLGAVVALAGPPAIRRGRRRRAIRAAAGGDTAPLWHELVQLLGAVDQPPPPGVTPLELARDVTPLLRPLAEVHTGDRWGSRPARQSELTGALRSFEDTEAHLLERASRLQRLRIRWWPFGRFSRWRIRR